MKGERFMPSLFVLLLSMFTIPDAVYSRSYPVYTARRLGYADPPHLQALVPFVFSAPRVAGDLEVPDYDDGYVPYGQFDDSGTYRLAPVYGYVRDQTGGDSFIDFEDRGNGDRTRPYGPENWFDEGERDENVDLVRNMILSEMDQGPVGRQASPRIVYGRPVEFSPDYEDAGRDETWYYGVPVYEESERTRNRKGDSLRELKHLARQAQAAEDRAPANAEEEPYFEDEVFLNRLEKRMSRSGRKNSVPLRKDGFRMSQERFHNPERFSPKWDAKRNYHEKGKEENGKDKTEVTTSVPLPKTSPTGQKEYVLTRPATPVRKPVQKGVYARGTGKTDVYAAIKKLIAMDGGVRKENRPRIQKRFVLSEDQLTSQLSGLKRISM